ncbi:MAG: PHP domain-containing protein [Methanomassiliicoccaceae archaeon]|jgi:predicted metal-dependent phosphoesterase TrpH|nr:PHP domain-containing protein [Methanomassiliicoccaceae archaeon]
MRSNINLHVHTKHSDGLRAMADVIDELKRTGVMYFSITDHDIVKGNAEAAELALQYGMKYCNGIELSCFLDGEGGFCHEDICHILGLDIDTEMMHSEQTRIRNERKQGLRKRSIPNVAEGIEAIHRSGGKAIWAHPFEIIRAMMFGTETIYFKEELSEDKVAEITKSMKGHNIDGLEVYYQEYDNHKITFLERLADEHGLCRSCGTDYHGRPHDRTCFEKEGITPDVTIVEHLRQFQ